jgi:hypothetical protein
VSSWRCPYCNQIATLLDSNISTNAHGFTKNNKDGHQSLNTQVIVCPNTKCRQYTITAWLYAFEKTEGGGEKLNQNARQTWKLKPQSAAKPLADYIPKTIQDDYYEACLIVELSSKASATLSRRCLQGMIRDFFGITEKTLYAEIQGIKNKVDQTTWGAIDAVRSIGNIGAHMEQDINVIVDVDPNEASLLIRLIETLIDEWYVQRHERAERMSKIVAVAASKKVAKAQDKNP